MKQNFHNLVKKIDLQAEEAQRVLNKMDPKRATPRHTIIKMPMVKDKERNLKAAREKQSYLEWEKGSAHSAGSKVNLVEER